MPDNTIDTFNTVGVALLHTCTRMHYIHRLIHIIEPTLHVLEYTIGTFQYLHAIHVLG